MKLNKFIIALAGFSAIALAGCNKGPAAEIVKKAVSMDLAFNSANTALIANTERNEFDGDKNQWVYLVTKQTVKVEGKSYVCDIEWSYDTNDARVKGYVADYDETHARLNFTYPERGESMAANPFQLTAVAKYNKQKSDAVTYWCDLKPKTYQYDEISVADLYANNGTKFNIIGSDGKITPNYGQQYLFVKVKGKITYLSPDGNWGLLADGANVVEIYSGNQLNLNTKGYAACAVGNYVTVYCDVATYNKNFQCSYINDIELLADHSSIAEPTAAAVKSVAELKALPYVGPYMNSMAKVTASVKAKALSGSAARGTVTLTDGENDLVVAYDYHTDKDGSQGVFSALDGKAVGNSVTIEGTLRYNNDHFEITPFLSSHIA